MYRRKELDIPRKIIVNKFKFIGNVLDERPETVIEFDDRIVNEISKWDGVVVHSLDNTLHEWLFAVTMSVYDTTYKGYIDTRPGRFGKPYSVTEKQYDICLFFSVGRQEETTITGIADIIRNYFYDVAIQRIEDTSVPFDLAVGLARVSNIKYDPEAHDPFALITLRSVYHREVTFDLVSKIMTCDEYKDNIRIPTALMERITDFLSEARNTPSVVDYFTVEEDMQSLPTM